VLTINGTQAKDLVAQLLVVNPSQRLSAEEALAHPWIEVTAKATTALPVNQLVPVMR
jgi:serine/threonine protein kinase